MPMFFWLRGGALALSGLFLAAALGLQGCGRGEAAKKERPAVPVAVALVASRDIPVSIKAIGRAEPLATVAIKSRVTGQLLSVHFREGQFVKKGDPLFTIDPAPFQVALREAQAQAARDQALADKAAEDLRRYDELVGRKAVSAAQHEQFLAEARARQATAQASQAAAERIKLELGFCYIGSPVNGQTGGLLAYAGNMIKANDDKAMVTITQVRPVLVSFAVPEQHLAQIRRFMSLGPLTVQALVPGRPGPPMEGSLVFVDNTVDTGTGTIRLKAEFANQDLGLWPGQFVNANLMLTTRQGVTVVPSLALASGQIGDYVFVVQPDQTVQPRPVKPGPEIDGLTVIEEGLKVGEQVVVDGLLRLAAGTRVAIKAPEPPAPGAGR